MKNISNIFIFISILVLSNCERNDSLSIEYDCYKKSTNFSSSGEILFWQTFFYLNGNNVRQENSTGDLWEFEFDHLGNQISVSFNGNRTEFEYNSENKVVKTKTYANGQLEYYTVVTYQDTLVSKSYTLSNNNDTTGWSFFYYNSENRRDSVISEYINTYFYYSQDVDSVISKTKLGHIKSREFFKYNNNKKIYEEIRIYTDFGDEFQYYIKTWEYNEIKLLVRQTEDYMNPSGEKQWFDTRKIYNESNNLSKTESYDETNQMLFYSNFFYDDEILVKVEHYDKLNNLNSYEIIENNCNK